MPLPVFSVAIEETSVVERIESPVGMGRVEAVAEFHDTALQPDGLTIVLLHFEGECIVVERSDVVGMVFAEELPSHVDSPFGQGASFGNASTVEAFAALGVEPLGLFSSLRRQRKGHGRGQKKGKKTGGAHDDWGLGERKD